jgi:hypothetical protein
MEEQRFRVIMAGMILYTLPVYLSFYQTLLFAGIVRAVILLLFVVLLMFLVDRSPALARFLSACLRSLPASWLSPLPTDELRQIAFATLTIPNAPNLSPRLQRPPPIFS